MKYASLVLSLVLTLAANATAGDDKAKDARTGIHINGVELTQQTVAEMERSYGIRIKDARLTPEQVAAVKQAFGVRVDPGRFWYDKISGAWGYEGLPAVGQVAAGVNIGGRLRANASGGGTPVTVNGRVLHRTEYQYLVRRFGSVIPGRYYLLPNGTYGLEGGPPMGTLAPQRRLSGLNRHGIYGSVIGGDGIVGYIPPSGSGGGGVTCAPDGGCIYD